MEIFFSKDIDGNVVRLGAEESAHCVRVLRHRAGDDIYVIDGEGTLMRCRLIGDSPKGAEAEIEERTPDWGGHPYELTLAVCPTKNNDRYAWFAEKAAEVGVDEIVPVIGDHSERKVFKTERLERILLSAAKQSLKGKVPEVREPLGVKEFIKSCKDSDALKLIAHCMEGERISVKEALERFDGSSYIILIGPEGDFSPEEVALAVDCGFLPVHLGESRLRTETAAVTAAEAVYFKYL